MPNRNSVLTSLCLLGLVLGGAWTVAEPSRGLNPGVRRQNFIPLLQRRLGIPGFDTLRPVPTTRFHNSPVTTTEAPLPVESEAEVPQPAGERDRVPPTTDVKNWQLRPYFLDPQADLTTLKFVQVVHRHGDRARGSEPFPTDPNANVHIGPKDGTGQLTAMGKAMGYELGKFLRARYDGFLSRYYSVNEFKASSSAADRVLQTCLSVLAGLYDPDLEDEQVPWRHKIKWQPIPMLTTAPQEDNKLAQWKSCLKYNNLKEKMEHSKESEEFNERFKDFFAFVTEKSGWNITNPQQFNKLYDLLIVEKSHGLTLPEWTNENNFWANGHIINYRFFLLEVGQGEMLQLRSGPLFTDILMNMGKKKKEIEDGGKPAQKFVENAAHDTTVFSVLEVLGANPNDLPTYASAAIFELHKPIGGDRNSYYMRVFYRNDTSRPAYELEIPGCGTPCKIKTLLAMKNDFIMDDAEWNQKCSYGGFPYRGATITTNPKYDNEFFYGKFPDSFLFGYATAAYQVEGGWNADGKGVSIWDEFVHRNPSPIFDNSTGDVACDSYHKYKEDVQLVKNAGGQFYRFSISWTRIFPDGNTNNVNQAGVDFYNNLINELIANGIMPLVTIYHWDLPQAIQEKTGGWISDDTIPFYLRYARFLFTTFGDRVKVWLTFNEPYVMCFMGYAVGVNAPGVKEPTEMPYKCAHTVLKAHSQAYRLYLKEFKEVQNGRVGITFDMSWYEPASQKLEDIEAAERGRQFKFGWFANPVFYGKYPDVMRKVVDARSKAEGRAVSRLPTFTQAESDALKGSWDFIGINHYTTDLATYNPNTTPGWEGDQEVTYTQDSSWPSSASFWLKDVPWGIRSLVNWVKDTYANPDLYITEGGFSDDGSIGIHDAPRVHYYRGYINELLKAVVKDGCNVKSYTGWSLMDNFEWPNGYLQRFGVHHVDFNDPDRKRTPKDSAKFLKKVFTDRGFPNPEEEDKANDINETD